MIENTQKNEFPCSIVIPTYNRIEKLKKCLDSLKSLNYERFEIIVVNDSSTDGTEEYLNKQQDDKIRIISNQKNLGPSRSRNIGVERSRYDYVVFIDDDCIADKNWLKEIAQELADDKTAFVIEQTFYVKKNHSANFPERIVENKNAYWPMSSNMAVNKKIFLQLGGFSHDFYKKYNNEDTEFAIRVVSKGFSFKRTKQAIVCHTKSYWSADELLSTAKNLSVWPVLKKLYPEHFLIFRPSNIKFSIFINPEDIFLVLMTPLLFIRYLLKGERNIKIFFIKWPILIILRRYYILKESVSNRVLMI